MPEFSEAQEGNQNQHNHLNGQALERLYKIGGASLVSNMIELFVENVTNRLQAAEEGLQQQDFQIIERSMHSLKSSAGNVGAELLQTMAAQIESLGIQHPWDDLRIKLRQVRKEFELVQEKLTEERINLTT